MGQELIAHIKYVHEVCQTTGNGTIAHIKYVHEVCQTAVKGTIAHIKYVHEVCQTAGKELIAHIKYVHEVCQTTGKEAYAHTGDVRSDKSRAGSAETIIVIQKQTYEKTDPEAACRLGPFSGVPERIRTSDTRFRRAVLCPLSYRDKSETILCACPTMITQTA